MSYNKKQHEPKREVEQKNFNLAKEYEKSIAYQRGRTINKTTDGILYCRDKFKPDRIFAMLV